MKMLVRLTINFCYWVLTLTAQTAFWRISLVCLQVSELAPYGSLLECLRRPAWELPFAVDRLCDFALQIARGMAFLAAERLVHRDLAARNVLTFALTRVKIADFGLSRCIGLDENYYRSEATASTKLPIAWCAPECVNLLKFTPASDVYAFGVTLWEMFSYGQVPWKGYSGSQVSLWKCKVSSFRPTPLLNSLADS